MSAPTASELATASDAEVLDRLRGLEEAINAAATEQLAWIAQAKSRGLAHQLGAKNMVDLLRFLLTIGARDAAAREKLADAVVTRRMPTGVPVEAAHPATAAALEAGEISPRAAGVVVSTVDRLPDCVLDEAHESVESVLLDFARDHDPETLARHAKAVSPALDQDGAYRDLDRAAQRRDIALHRRADGSASMSSELTCELAEYVQTLIDTMSKPHLDADGRPDPRTPSQRRHDALLEGLKLLFASGRLPSANGCATTLVLRMDVDAFAAGTGVAHTAHGYAIPTAVAKSWLDPEARAVLVLISKTKGIEAYSDRHRLFTEQQRLAMFARDKGCSYWGCDTALAWTQAHHVTDFARTRRTSVDDGALACTGNHSTFEQMGWRSVMLNGFPHWVPPSWVDPQHRPRRNSQHD